MPQSNLLELTYFDPKAQVRLTTYADTIITEPNGREESLAAVRFGGYPEMVRAMSDAIYGGGTVDLIQNGNTFHLKSKPKSYQRQLAHDGAYATATLMIQDEALSVDPTEEDDGEDDGSVSGLGLAEASVSGPYFSRSAKENDMSFSASSTCMV